MGYFFHFSHYCVCVLAYLNFNAVLALPKTARSAQTQKSISFIWIVLSTLYVYLWTMVEKRKKKKKALLHDTYLYNVQQGGRFTTMEIAQKGILEWNNSHKLFVLQIYFCGTTQIMTSFFLFQSLQLGKT